MGTFCDSCKNQRNNNNNNEDSNSSKGSKNDTLSETILLPKQCVDEIIKKEKPKITENNNINENKENNDINNNDNNNNKNKKYLKSKTIMINNNNLKSSKVINKSLLKTSQKIKKLNSLEISDEKKEKLINNEINLLEKKYSKIKRKLSKSQIVLKNKKVSKAPVFARRKKKSTTLMENKNVINQLRKIQMSIPLFQESLVQEQKGNPNDKYIIGRKIGAGSYGTVYEATNIVFKSKVAMKMIIKHENMNPAFIKNEIDILKKLSHPNIVKIYEFYESTNCFYLINEFCDQGELYNYINKSTLNEQQLSIIFYQVFSGLCYLHENNILHRDIKPENILISKKEQDLNTNEEYFWIKIIDFGTAKIFEKGEKEKKIVGSAYYIAPEVLDQNYNEKCDTWSVGVILYMFLVGRAPFDGYNNEEIINSIRTKNYDENNPKLLEHSAEVRDLINNLLNKNIEERFSAKEALNHEWFKKFNGRKLFANFYKNDIEPFINNLFNYTLLSKIQQLVIAFLVHNMPTTDIFGNILKIYRHFNELGDCKLTKEELIKGLSNYRDEREVKKIVGTLFISLDGDNNGYIEYEEFLRACVDKKEIFSENNLKCAFKFLDQNGSGKLNSQKILFALTNKEYNSDKKYEIAIEKDINDVDGDGDGEINFDEFKKLIFCNLI
jgi:calcium-dependent protein kinase